MLEASFVWDDNFVTHLPDVDEQHRTLIGLFDELARTLFKLEGRDDAQLADIYARLLDYTAFHFREEEDMMVRIGLDARHQQVHRSLHQQFVDQLQLLWGQRGTMSDQAATVAGFLTSWLGLHILGIDQSMARQVSAIEAGLTPQAAFAQEQDAHDQGTQALLKMIGRLYAVLSTQNAQLASANQSLEERVAQRTQELAQANERLRELSRTDALLGIANRAYFNERLEQACALSRRSRRPMGLVMIDVDHFKRYNDRYGHVQGDGCLQAVARAVAGCLRRGTDLVARYGGEELAVILPDTDAAGAIDVAERMVQAVRALGLEHADSLVADHVTISAGVFNGVPAADAPGISSSAAIVSQADAALYRAKEQGRNRCLPG
ncbi:GGDEF domain-containing protein [Melaminivora sp.]